MASRSTPEIVFLHYLRPLEQALGCIASERFAAIRWTPFEVGRAYSLVLNRDVPEPVKSNALLSFATAQVFRIGKGASCDPTSYRVQVVRYRYAISTADGREVLGFHWTPEEDADMITTPHLHVGSVNISDTAPLDPKTFN